MRIIFKKITFEEDIQTFIIDFTFYLKKSHEILDFSSSIHLKFPDSGRKLSRKVKIVGGGVVFVDGNGKYVGENLEEDIQV